MKQVLLCLSVLFTLLWGCKNKVSDSSSVGDHPRFIVISDIHLGASESKEKVANTLQVLLEKTPAADALVVVGDLTDNGRDDQYDDLISIFSSHVPADMPVYYLMGNHDHYTADAEARYEEKLQQDLHQFFSIKEYPFITISMSGKHTDNYDDRAKAFLSENLKKAQEEYPGKPIFVFIHCGVKNTAYGTGADEGWGTDAFESILKPYPQAMVFSGHSHFPVGDPRSIHQEYFTSLNDGSVTYSEIEKGFTEGIHPPGYREVTEGFIVNVKSNGDVEVERWDTYRNEEILPRWTIKAPHDGSAFTYKGRTGGKAPYFVEQAKPEVSEIASTSCLVRFIQADDDEVVHHYRVEAVDKLEHVDAQARVFSRFYLNSEMPETLEYRLPGLKPGVEYRVRVKAVDSYGNESDWILGEEFVGEK